MAALTRSRGWSEDFVRWQLPPWRGWQYLLADLTAEGHTCLYLDRDDNPAVQKLRAYRQQLQRRPRRETAEGDQAWNC